MLVIGTVALPTAAHAAPGSSARPLAFQTVESAHTCNGSQIYDDEALQAIVAPTWSCTSDASAGQAKGSSQLSASVAVGEGGIPERGAGAGFAEFTATDTIRKAVASLTYQVKVRLTSARVAANISGPTGATDGLPGGRCGVASCNLARAELITSLTASADSCPGSCNTSRFAVLIGTLNVGGGVLPYSYEHAVENQEWAFTVELTNEAGGLIPPGPVHLRLRHSASAIAWSDAGNTASAEISSVIEDTSVTRS